MRCYWYVLALAGVVFSSFGNHAHASGELFPHTFRAAVVRSEAILYGKVLDKSYARTPDGAHIWSRYSLDVEAVLAGDIGTSVFEFWCYGGDIDGTRLAPENVPVFEPGERIVLLSDRDNWLGSSALGNTGVLREVEDPVRGRLLVNHLGRAITSVGTEGLKFELTVRERHAGSHEWRPLPSSPNEGRALMVVRSLDEIAAEAAVHAIRPTLIKSESVAIPAYGRIHDAR